MLCNGRPRRSIKCPGRYPGIYPGINDFLFRKTCSKTLAANRKNTAFRWHSLLPTQPYHFLWITLRNRQDIHITKLLLKSIFDTFLHTYTIPLACWLTVEIVVCRVGEYWLSGSCYWWIRWNIIGLGYFPMTLIPYPVFLSRVIKTDTMVLLCITIPWSNFDHFFHIIQSM